MNRIRTSVKSLLLVVIGIIFSISSVCFSAKADNNEYGAEAYNYLQVLTDNFQNRVAGTASCIQAGEWISANLASFGYAVEKYEFETSAYFADYCATKFGTSSETIYLGASYDSVQTAAGIENASSVAVLLELARRFSNTDTYYTIKFCFYGASEDTVKNEGAQQFVEQIILPMNAQENAVCYIDLDGIAGGDNLYVYGGSYDGNKLRRVWVSQMAMDIAKRMGIRLNYLPENMEGIQSPVYLDGAAEWFDKQGIAYAAFSSGVWENGNKIDSVLPNFEMTNGLIAGTEMDTVASLEAVMPGRLQYQMSAVSMLVSQFLRETIPDSLIVYQAEYAVGEGADETEPSSGIEESMQEESSEEQTAADENKQENHSDLQSEGQEKTNSDAPEFSTEEAEQSMSFSNLFQIVLIIILTCVIVTIGMIIWILRPKV